MQNDLRHVCEYVCLDEEWRWAAGPLLLKLAAKGRRQFPQDPYFPGLLAWAC